MEHGTSWRELLGKLISNPQEKQRIAHELQVNPITLTRWANNEATPRLQKLRALLNALPEYRSILLPLLEEEFGENFDEIAFREEAEDGIPSAFYGRVLQAYEYLPPAVRSWSMFDLILQQALKQLDPERVGMEITIARCVYNIKKRSVRCVREIVGCGTPPWNRAMEQRLLLLGAESLAGFVVTSGHSVAIQDYRDAQNPYPARWLENERSAAGHPILRGGEVAGCLLISCAQIDYFTPTRRALIQHYADLLALAFEPEEFYKRDAIQLYIMPSVERQKKTLASFRQRVSTLLIQASKDKIPLDVVQAEQLVWQQMEEELLDPDDSGA